MNKIVAIFHTDITYYGVMTKADKFDSRSNDRVADREKLFLNTLGITRNRFASVVNYCPDVDQDLTYEHRTLPELDVKFLRFMKQVLR